MLKKKKKNTIQKKKKKEKVIEKCKYDVCFSIAQIESVQWKCVVSRGVIVISTFDTQFCLDQNQL